MNPVIFTSFNDDIDPEFYRLQKQVLEKFELDVIYRPLRYSWHHSEMVHGDVLNKFVNELFYDKGYDTILIMDIDCIPLSREGIVYTFGSACSGRLVGNAQRSNHINNDKHVYAASSFICFTEQTYSSLGRPSFLPNKDGDTCEQLTYNAEKERIKVELFQPLSYDSPIDDEGNSWPLNDTMPNYGIGTTFGVNNIPINYHLFASRLHKYDDIFFKKCDKVLNNGS